VQGYLLSEPLTPADLERRFFAKSTVASMEVAPHQDAARRAK
jgi:hypothetical protein